MPRISLFLLCLVLSTGCIRARLLHPPGQDNSVPPINGTYPDSLSTASGTLKGTGVTLQARFGLGTPTQLTATGVQLNVAN